MSFWNVIRDKGRWLSEAAQQVYDDVHEGFRDASRGASGVGGKATDTGGCGPPEEIKDGVERVGSGNAGTAQWAGDEVARVWEGGSSLLEGVVEGTVAVVNDVGEGLYHVGHGLTEAARGNFAAGAREIGSGAAQATIGGLVDGVLLAGARAASAVQVVAHLEERERTLTPDEVDQLRAIFADAIDYAAVRIKEGDAGVFSLNRRPFTTGNTVYMKMSPSDAAWKGTLVHEMVHVWQYQNGGADYQSKSLAAQYITRDAYQWQSALLEEKPWPSLNPEDQGALIEHLFLLGFFATGALLITAADGRTIDRTSYAKDVVAQLRAERGAP